MSGPNAEYERPVLTEAQAARVLADQAWEGRWNPADYLNVLPLAEHTARALYDAGFVVVARNYAADVPALLDALEAAEAEVARLRERLRERLAASIPYDEVYELLRFRSPADRTEGGAS